MGKLLFFAILFSCSLSNAASQTKLEAIPHIHLLPYLRVGGVHSGLHYTTILLVGNPTTSPNSGTIEIYDNSVEPLPVALNGDRGMMSHFSWELGPESLTQFQLTSPSESSLSGWLRVEQIGNERLDLYMIVQVYQGDS